jgi:hypothetical protein
VFWGVVVLAAVPAPTLFLDWHAESPCPDAAWVTSEVRRLRGSLEIAESADAALLTVRATASHEGGQWKLDVETQSHGVSGHRAVTGPTCQRAADAAAVVLSLALADGVAAAEQAAEVSQPLEPAQPPDHSSFGVALSFVGRAGALPSFTPGASLSLAFVRRYFRVELTAYTPAATQRIGSGPTASDLSAPLNGELGIGIPVIRQGLQVDFAADVTAAWVNGQGVGATVVRSGSAAWAAIEGGAALRFSLWHGLGARIEGRIGAAFVRPYFTVDGATIYDTHVLTGRASAGLEWLF